MNKPSAPCKDCGNRFVGCHSTCLAYIDFKQEHDAKKQMIFDAKAKEAIVDSTFAKAKRKRMRRLGKK